MEGSSQQRNIQPLLRDDEGPVAGPRMGAYAPPAEQASVAATMGGHASMREPHDLHLTDTGASGQIASSLNANGGASFAEAEDLPQLPPLISYCAYVKYGCVFMKWIFLVAIANAVTLSICLKSDYFGYDGIWPVDTWKGGLLAATWMATAVWLYLSAKVVERDVQQVDHMAHYEQGSTTEDPGDFSAPFSPNYDHLYGKASRKLDRYFQKQTAAASLPEGTSGLVNLSYALWSLGFGIAVFLGTATLLGKHYEAQCDRSKLPLANSTGGDGHPEDFQDMGDFPSDVQEWIVEDREPYRSYNDLMVDDDRFDEGGNDEEVYSFPTASEYDYGSFAAMTDGTIFFAAQPPHNKDDTTDGNGSSSASKQMVLVESSASGDAPKYHLDFRKPRMIIPIENTIDYDNNGNQIATQYCFLLTKESDKKKKRRSWDAMIRTSYIHCIVTSGGGTNTTFSHLDTMIVWTDKTQRGPQLVAASSGGLVLISHIGNDDGQSKFQEVVSVNPSTMEKKNVYHLTTSMGNEYNDYGRDGMHTNTRCVYEKVQVFSGIAALVVLGLCGAWLVLREGVAAGVTPIMFAIAILTWQLGRDQYENGVPAFCMTGGFIFFHCVLCCNNGRMCHLPSWIGRDMYVWALYSWILAYFFLDLIWGEPSGVFILSLVYLGLTGIILEHPIVHLIGFASVLVGVFWFLLWPFFGRYVDDLIGATFSILIGMGIIGLAEFLTNNRKFCTALCRPISRAGRTMYYGASVNPSTASAQTPTAPSSTRAVVTAQV